MPLRLPRDNIFVSYKPTFLLHCAIFCEQITAKAQQHTMQCHCKPLIDIINTPITTFHDCVLLS